MADKSLEEVRSPKKPLGVGPPRSLVGSYVKTSRPEAIYHNMVAKVTVHSPEFSGRSARTAAPRLSAVEAPPALKGYELFKRGTLAAPGGIAAWWRQDSETLQVIVLLPEDVEFRRDVKVALSRKRIALSIAGADVLVGELAHDASADESDWYVEEAFDWAALDGTDARPRCLIVDIKKRESFVNWMAPLARGNGEIDESASEPQRRVLIGGKGKVQKEATAQQLASYQILQKFPDAVRGDVYCRAPPDNGVMSDRLYFVGKVIAEGTGSAAASLAAQVHLVKEHARLYLPEIFGSVADEDIELWLAPGNTEMRVAQDDMALSRWEPPDDVVALPVAGACGFEPEVAPPPHMGGVEPFSVRRDAAGEPLEKRSKLSSDQKALFPP